MAVIRTRVAIRTKAATRTRVVIRTRTAIPSREQLIRADRFAARSAGRLYQQGLNSAFPAEKGSHRVRHFVQIVESLSSRAQNSVRSAAHRCRDDREKEGKKKEDTEKEDTEKKDTEKEKFRTLEFQNVSFRYPGTERYILKNLSFQLQAGKKYALVGANGAGKTTIVKLINGLYRDYEGKILVNGEDIRNFGRDFLSNVFQDFARYPVSIRENITIGRKDAVSDEELWAAVEEVGLTRTIEKLKDGLDTVLGKAKEESLDLSGGQWQKLALARCALSRGELRILDEPTSAMDPVYESEIYQSFRRMSEGKTVLLITHRLASVKMSDHIFVISDGTVAEEGSHAQLMEAERAMPEGGAMSEEQAMQEEAVPGSGLYRRMYEEQAKWYEEGGARV